MKMFECYNDGYGDWSDKETSYLVVCVEGLRDWFHIPASAKTLWMGVRAKAGKRNANEVEIKINPGRISADILLLNGEWTVVGAYSFLKREIHEAGNHAYIGFWYR